LQEIYFLRKKIILIIARVKVMALWDANKNRYKIKKRNRVVEIDELEVKYPNTNKMIYNEQHFIFYFGLGLFLFYVIYT
jgi:VanZ family protein